MPTPIPEWDRPRILLNYLAKRQLSHRTTTLKEACVRIGVGAEKVIEILSDLGVKFELVQVTEKKKNRGVEILLQDVPESLARVFHIEREKIAETYREFSSREIELEPETDWRELRKKQRAEEKIKKMRYFLREDIGA